MLKFDKNFKIGTKVMIEGLKGWCTITEINNETSIKVAEYLGSFQRGHIKKFTNKSSETKKITKATVKSFVNKNAENLYINVKSVFDGMTDGIENRKGGFKLAVRRNDQSMNHRSMGFNGISFTTTTKNWCEVYEDENFNGYRIDNCCGSFIVAIQKQEK